MKLAHWFNGDYCTVLFNASTLSLVAKLLFSLCMEKKRSGQVRIPHWSCHYPTKWVVLTKETRYTLKQQRLCQSIPSCTFEFQRQLFSLFSTELVVNCWLINSEFIVTLLCERLDNCGICTGPDPFSPYPMTKRKKSGLAMQDYIHIHTIHILF